MSTQQDIYAAGSESRPPMLNKENYVPWSSRLLRYAKSRPNEKLIHNSILNGPYVRKLILNQIEADDQAIQTILLGLPEDIYAIVDSCETAQKIWLRVQQMMKGSDIGIQEKKAKLFNEWERFTSNVEESIESYYHRFLKLMNDLKRNKHFPEKIATDYTQLYDFLKYNQKEVDELKAERLAKNQDLLALMANSNNPYAFPAPHQDQSSFNQNYLQQPMPNPEDITDPTTAMNMTLALMAKAFKLNYSTPTNNNQRISSNPRNRHIAQPGMNMGQDRQMQMVGGNGGNQFRQYAGQNAGNPAGYNDVIGNQVMQNAVQNLRVQNVGIQNGLIGVQGNGNQNQIGNDGSAEVHENCDDNEILNMFTQEEQYTELLEPILESHQVPHNDNDVISEDTSMEQGRETVEQHPVNFEETRALYESLYQNLAIEVEKVNSVNRKLKETNADLTTELARFKNQERCGSASSTTPPTPIATPTPISTVVAALRLTAAAKDEGTGSRPGVPNVPSDDLEEEISWNSSDDEDVDDQTKGRDESEVKGDGKSHMYMIFSQMLKSFNREDLEDLYKVVKATYGSTRPLETMDYLLWSDMKKMLEPHVEDEVWKMQQGYKVLE
nr:hypothetical protein [Tanacetum cinerariifolium]